MRLALTALLLLATPALADDGVELFVDKGDTYVRAGSDSGLQRGTSLNVIAKGGKRIGAAIVMEVWPALARVNLDESARADKSPSKYVTVAKAAAPAVPEPSAPPPPPPAPAAQNELKRVPAVAASPAAPPSPAGLKGFAKYAGVGPWTALQVFNENNFDWTHCNVTMMPMASSYFMQYLRAGDHEMIGRSNFSNRDYDGDPTSVRLKCAQGEGTIPVR